MSLFGRVLIFRNTIALSRLRLMVASQTVVVHHVGYVGSGYVVVPRMEKV